MDQVMTSIKRLRFALIGTGDFGPHFAPYVNEVTDLVAICDPNPQSRADFVAQTKLQLPEFDHHEQLLAEADLDGVVIASPNFTHKDIAVAAAERGKHVLCEKAMATSVP
ncbi:MAG: Gfo/Idh/MocA family oxidoreductase, partial [Planctomycetes bacterium]|nr:Gfo/Idh/MocA family oxidoreductase [Planctomycetota bacterium]